MDWIQYLKYDLKIMDTLQGAWFIKSSESKLTADLTGIIDG